MSKPKKKVKKSQIKIVYDRGLTKRNYKIIGATVIIFGLGVLLVANFKNKPTASIQTQTAARESTAAPTKTTQDNAELATPTPLSYDNWNMYQNDTYHYSVSYQGVPSDIKRVVDTNNQPEKPFLDQVSLPYTSYKMTISIWKTYVVVSDEKSFKDWCQKSSDDYYSSHELVVGIPCSTDTPAILTTVGGVNAYQKGNAVFIPHDNYIYEIYFYGNIGFYQKEEWDQRIEAVNYVLSTFKFL